MFAESNNILIQSLKCNAKNKNTQKSTNNRINVWTKWIGFLKAERVNPVRQNKNKPTALCLKLLYVYYYHDFI